MPNVVSFVASIAEPAHGYKSHTQSLTHSPSLFDAREPKLLLWNNTIQMNISIGNRAGCNVPPDT